MGRGLDPLIRQICLIKSVMHACFFVSSEQITVVAVHETCQHLSHCVCVSKYMGFCIRSALHGEKFGELFFIGGVGGLFVLHTGSERESDGEGHIHHSGSGWSTYNFSPHLPQTCAAPKTILSNLKKTKTTRQIKIPSSLFIFSPLRPPCFCLQPRTYTRGDRHVHTARMLSGLLNSKPPDTPLSPN